MMREGAKDPGAGSRAAHLGFAAWHTMLAHVEGMAEEHWESLVQGRDADFQEWNDGMKVLRDSVENFRLAADSCGVALDNAQGELERGYLEADVRTWNRIADSVEEMAARMERRDVPSIEEVHAIDDLLREQHMAMDRKTTARAALARMRGET